MDPPRGASCTLQPAAAALRHALAREPAAIRIRRGERGGSLSAVTSPPHPSRSPSGRYEVRFDGIDVRMSHWIERPILIDLETGQVLVSLADTSWSADQVRWVEDGVVELTMRRYPGDHEPATVVARLSAREAIATVGDGPPRPVAELEPLLDAAIRLRDR